MQSISTKTGDGGESGLANGERLPKDHLIFEVIGTLDEVNSWLGLVVAQMHDTFPDYRDQLLMIQDTLFYIGAELAKSPKTKFKEAHLTKLEKASQDLQQSLKDEWHTKFLLPGGTELGARLDIARSVCRRAERLLATLAKQSSIRPLLQQYINRLSDFLYLVRVAVNAKLEYQEKEFEAKK